jgi:hypothetical protein
VATATTLADLSSCTSLRNLKLHHPAVASVTQVLRTVQHTTLRYLDLFVPKATAEEWAELSIVLRRPCFSQLNTLNILVYLDKNENAIALDALKPLENAAAFRLQNKLL